MRAARSAEASHGGAKRPAAWFETAGGRCPLEVLNLDLSGGHRPTCPVHAGGRSSGTVGVGRSGGRAGVSSTSVNLGTLTFRSSLAGISASRAKADGGGFGAIPRAPVEKVTYEVIHGSRCAEKVGLFSGHTVTSRRKGARLVVGVTRTDGSHLVALVEACSSGILALTTGIGPVLVERVKDSVRFPTAGAGRGFTPVIADAAASKGSTVTVAGRGNLRGLGQGVSRFRDACTRLIVAYSGTRQIGGP